MTRRSPVLWLALALLAAGPALAQTEFPLTLSAPVSGDSYGYDVDVDGDRMVVGVPGDDRGGNAVGAAVIYERTVSGWAETATLFPPTQPGPQTAGHSVALDGDRVLVGAPVLTNYTGAVYVYEFVANQWALTATLTPSDPAQGKGIGWAVALDGDRAVLGAPGDATGGFNTGAAYVFDLANGTWTQTAKLTATAPSADATLGYDVGVSGDRVIAGAPVAVTVAGNGAAHVFEKTQSGWTEAVLTASDGASGDDFGRTVAISGGSAVVGAPRNSVNASRDGRAYVFEQVGNPWVEQAILDGTLPQTYRSLGGGVDIDGDRIVLGAFSSPTETTPGAAFVYARSGPSWTLTDRLTASDGQQGGLFGFAVAVDGLRVAVGAYGHDVSATDEGKAYVFELTNAPPPLLLAADGLTIGRASVLVGGVHSNAGLTLGSQSGGYSGSYLGDLTAVGAIGINRRNVVDGDVTAGGALTVHSSATVTGTAVGNAAVAPVALPGLTSVSPGGQNVTVGSGQTLALAPGATNRVRVRNGATLVLTAGTYDMARLALNRHASVALDVSAGPIALRTNELVISADVTVTVMDGANPAPQLSDRVTIQTTQSADLSVGARTQLAGTLEAPAALVRLRADAAFTGALAAREIVVNNRTTLLAHGETAPQNARRASAVVSDAGDDAPAAVGLSSAPNPFAGRTTLTVALAQAADLRLTVHDLLGREVRLLADGPYEAGTHRIALDAQDLLAGVYIVRMATPEGVATERVTLVR